MLQLDNTNLKSNPGRLQLQTSRGPDLPRLVVVLRCLKVAEQVSQALYISSFVAQEDGWVGRYKRNSTSIKVQAQSCRYQ